MRSMRRFVTLELSPSHRAGDDEDLALEDAGIEVRPGVALPAVLTHVGVDARRDVMVDEADLLDRDAVLAHDGCAGVDEALGVAHLGALLEVAVDVGGLEAAEVPVARDGHGSDCPPWRPDRAMVEM